MQPSHWSPAELLTALEPEDPARIAVLAGAGISMVGVTQLPSGPDLLKQAIGLLVLEPRLFAAREAALTHKRFNTLVPEVVLQRFYDIVKDIPETLYLPFTCAAPNGIHSALARLGVAGGFLATTNFDLAIEHADAQGVPADLPVHLHGRADDRPSLVHTIRAVGRGLPVRLERRFIESLRGRRLLVVGYSGNDREIMAALVASRPASIAWTIRSADDWALANIVRWQPRLPSVDVRIVDLEAAERIASSCTCSFMQQPRSPAPLDQAPGPLAQLEIVLAVLLQLEDYRLALSTSEIADQLVGDNKWRASIGALRSFAARRTGDLELAMRLAEQACEYAVGGSLSVIARAKTELALACLDLEQADVGRARPLLEEAARLLNTWRRREADDTAAALFASAEHNLGHISEEEGRYEDALTHYQRALALKRELGDLPYQISSERDTALMLILLDRPDEATPHLERFRALAEAYSDPYELAYFDLALGRHRLRQNRPDDAVAPLRRALASFSQLGDRASIQKAHDGLAAATGNHGHAGS